MSKIDYSVHMLVALVKGYQDPGRREVRAHGMDERDLAVEANILIPADIDMPNYDLRRHRAVVQAIQQMENRGWVHVGNKPRDIFGFWSGIKPTPKGERLASLLMRPWYQKALSAFERRMRRLLSGTR